MPWTGKPAKKPRSTRVVYACASCTATASTPKELQALSCERRPATSTHTKFVVRVRALIAEGKHEASLLDGCRQLLDCICPTEPDHRRLPRKMLPPPALRAHDVVAAAWPFLSGSRHAIELRFPCLRCATCRKNRRALETKKACDAVVRGGGGSHQARARPRHQDPDSTVARAAVHVLQLLDKVLPTVAAAPAAPKEIVALADAGEAGLGFEDRGCPATSRLRCMLRLRRPLLGLTCLRSAGLSAIVAMRCQRIAYAARGLALRRALIRELVIPLFSWSAPWSKFKVSDVQSWTKSVAFALWGRHPAPGRSRLLLWHVLGRPYLHPEHAMDFRCSRRPAVVVTRPAIVPRWPAMLKKWGWTACAADARTLQRLKKPPAPEHLVCACGEPVPARTHLTFCCSGWFPHRARLPLQAAASAAAPAAS